jgi:hypothetical protein
MELEAGITGVAHAIQLAVAPVFLLSGIGAMLAVMTNRLSRVVDRMRAIERDNDMPEREFAAEWDALASRAKLIARSIALCTVTALLICTVIAVMFAGTFLGVDTSNIVAAAFVVAMITFVVGLMLFLREIIVAITSLRTEPRRRRQRLPQN